MAQDKRGNFDVKRSNYFQGMMLVDKDFKDEQSYHRQMRQNHNLELHTWGVVRGLDVSLAAGGAVTVSEGLAIDASGREVWWKGGAIQPGGQFVEGNYLVIEWNQEERDEYPQMVGKNLRLIDTASFSWKSDAGDSNVVLAQLLQGMPDNRGRRVAASVRANQNDVEIRPVTADGALRLMTGAPPAARLTIDASGYVGIGTSSNPQAPLHIKFPSGIRSSAAVLNLEGTDHVYLQWYPLGFASGRKGWVGYGVANDKNLTIQNEYAEGHLILGSASGKVGIGTVSPDAALQVRPTPADRGSATFFSGAGAMLATATSNGGSVPAAAETALVLTRAGIGNQAYANFARFDLKRYENADTRSRTQLDLRLSHENLGEEANNTPVIMSLRSNGNVGIGTPPTAARLSIHTNPGPYDGTLMDFVVSQYKLSLRSKSLEGDTVSYHFDLVNNLSRADDFLVFHKGNVGIGVMNPQNALDVKGALYIRKGALQFADENGNQYKDNWIGMANNIDGATRWLHIGGITGADDSVRRLVFAADRTFMSGNVGIGTNAPGDQLQVGGGRLKFAVGDAYGQELDWGTAYAGFNAIRLRESGQVKWRMEGDGAHNGGALIYGDIFGKLRFVTVESKSTSGQDLTDTQLRQKIRMVVNEQGVSIGSEDIQARLRVVGGEQLVPVTGRFTLTPSSNDTNIYVAAGSDVSGLRQDDWVVKGGERRQLASVTGSLLTIKAAPNFSYSLSDAPLYVVRPGQPIFRADDYLGRPVFTLSNVGNVGIGTDPSGNNRLAIFRRLGGDDPDVLQHDYQLEIRNGISNRALAIGLLDNGKGALQAKAMNVGYNDLLLNPVGGNVGVGTSKPLCKLHVVSPGVANGFGGENDDGTSLSGTVPIVAQTTGTAIGIINGNGRQVFALNIGNDAGTKSARGFPIFYDKYDGNWRPSLHLKNGNVGIGTDSPQARLDVGDMTQGRMKSILARMDEGNNQGTGTCIGVNAYTTQGTGAICFAIEHYFYGIRNGWIGFSRGGGANDGQLVLSRSWRTDGQDLAELFATAEPIVPGDVVVFDEQKEMVKLCANEADRCVIGIASSEPAGILGKDDNNAMPIALCGRVPCNVDADIAPIRLGDLLTTSPTKGHAQKVLDEKRAVGAVIGKALGSLEKGKGKITVLVALA